MLSLINSKRWSEGTILVVMDSIELYILVVYSRWSATAKQDTLHDWFVFLRGNWRRAVSVVSMH